MSGLVARWRDDRRGAVAIVAVVGMGMALACCAVAIDLGSLYLRSRKLQGMADLAALAAAANLDSAQQAASDTVAANGWGGPVTSALTLGRYRADSAVAPSARFAAGGPGTPDAAAVTLTGQAQLFFATALLGRSTLPVSRTAVAAQVRLAAFSIGSREVAVQGGVANAVLSALTGSNVSLSAVDYQALASAKVDLFSYMDAFCTRLALQGASYDQVLSATASGGSAMAALADTLTSTGQVAAAAAATRLVPAASKASAPLGSLLQLGPYQDQDRASSGTGVQVGALDLAEALAGLGTGTRQGVADLGATVPGLTAVAVMVALGERPNHSPWLSVDDEGTVVVRTAQARVLIQASVPGAVPGGLVRASIFAQIASGQAKLASIGCPADPAARSATLSVSPSLGTLALADIDATRFGDFTQSLATPPAALLNLPLVVKATGAARVDLGGESWFPATFTSADIAAGAVKTVQTRDIAQASVASLLAGADVQVQALGFGVGLNAGVLTPAVRTALTTAAPPLDAVLDEVTDTLGVHLGEADVKVEGLRCRAASLVR